MRRSPGYYTRLLLIIIETDWARAVLALLAMGILALLDFQLLLVLILPVLVYVGLWLATSPEMPKLPRAKNADYTSCLKLRDELALLSAQVKDEEASRALGTISTQLDRILDAIDEDKKYDSTTLLLSLIGITKDYLEDYLKAVRRGFDGAGTQEAVIKNLALLSVKYKNFWDQLNRHVIVDLVALGETIQELFQQLELTIDEPPIEMEQQERKFNPPEQISPVARAAPNPSVSANGDVDLARLSPRELEVACLLAKPMTDRQIADALFISRRTAQKHVTNICLKLDVGSRTAIALYAVHHGLCPDNTAT